MANQATGPRNPEEWLRRLIELMPDIEKQRELKNKFCPKREATIAELKKIKDKLSAMDKAKKYADLGGAGVAIISSVLAIAGQVGSLLGLIKPDVCKVMVQSGKLGNLGGRSFSYGSKGANKMFQCWNAKTVTAILEEDKKCSTALMKSLIRLEELKTTVEEVMSFDMFLKIVNFFKTKRNVNVEEANADLPPQIHDCIQSSNLSKLFKAKIQEWMEAIYQSLPSRRSLFNIVVRCKDIDLSTTRQMYDDLYLIKAEVLKMGPTEPLLKTNYDYCTWEGIGNAVMLGLDVLSVCNQYLLIGEKCRNIDVECEFVTKLEKCISLLQQELDVIKSLNFD